MILINSGSRFCLSKLIIIPYSALYHILSGSIFEDDDLGRPLIQQQAITFTDLRNHKVVKDNLECQRTVGTFRMSLKVSFVFVFYVDCFIAVLLIGPFGLSLLPYVFVCEAVSQDDHSVSQESSSTNSHLLGDESTPDIIDFTSVCNFHITE